MSYDFHYLKIFNNFSKQVQCGMQVFVRLLNSTFTNKTCLQNPLFHLFHKSTHNILHNRDSNTSDVQTIDLKRCFHTYYIFATFDP